MENNLFWTIDGSICPFDKTDMGKYKKRFKSNSSNLTLPIWVCPLCDRFFVKYINTQSTDLLDSFPSVQCRFLSLSSPKIVFRKKVEEADRLRKGAFEPTAHQLKSFKPLFQNYCICEDEFCTCFTESQTVFFYFSRKYSDSSKDSPSFRKASKDERIDKLIRAQIEHFCKKEEELSRAKEIQAFFLANYRDEDGRPYLLDEEQALAVAVSEQRLLATARAGSGKTRTIVARIVYLLDQCHVSPSHILSLAFNNNVPIEINQRVNNLLESRWPGRKDQITIARTFHGLAYEIVSPRRVLSGSERTKFIQELIVEQKEIDPSFKASVYESFRKEDNQIRKKQFHNAQAFYDSLRNAQYETLNGEIVKSRGEKWIADYLFERGIDYRYEPAFYPKYITIDHLSLPPDDASACCAFLDQQIKTYPSGKAVRKTVKPDFLLTNYSYVWEHWGIDEKNPARFQGKNESFDLSWEEYHDLMRWKRFFWGGPWRSSLRPGGRILNFSRKAATYVKSIKDVSGLLETSVEEMDAGRASFEKKLDSLMDSLGIPHILRPKAELEEEVWNKQIKRFTSMIESFIDKYEQHFPNGNDSSFLQQWRFSHTSDRTNNFLALGSTILNRYQEVLASSKKPARYTKYFDYSHDFNQLIAEAARFISQGKADNLLSSYQYLFIDEYQDFSELFYSFITAILSRNPEIKLFCVGDAWQAINRFAGADTVYFEKYNSFFPGSRILEIRTNYRSTKKVVSLSNRFMRSCGFLDSPAISYSRETLPECLPKDVNDVYVSLQGNDEHSEDYLLSHLLPVKAQTMTQTQYLKSITEIVKRNSGSEILVLSRTNSFGTIDLACLQKSIQEYLTDQISFSHDDAEKVKVMTMHKSKGLQADIVIIIEANQNNIPKIHPDNSLYEVFGETPEIIFEDEERLFYVAITRAKKQFWVLYDSKPTVFIEYLRGK